MAIPSKFLVYALVDPRDGRWRYIGKSCSGLKRPKEHTRPSHLRPRTKKTAWIKGLLSQGLRPETEVLEEFPSHGLLNEAEIEWIAESHRVGIRLTNSTDGGDGAPMGNTYGLGRVHSAETRSKRSIAMMGHVITSVTRAKISLAATGRIHSAETRTKISLANMRNK